jgi:type II secretory pathway pseudopilin PulG
MSRGQASVETLLILAVVLAIVAGLVPLGRRSNEVSVAMSAARTGAGKAIAELNMQYGCAIDIEHLSFAAGDITIYLTVRGGPPPDNQTIRDNVRDEALRYICRALTGGFPDVPRPIRTQDYTYDVSVELERVIK